MQHECQHFMYVAFQKVANILVIFFHAMRAWAIFSSKTLMMSGINLLIYYFPFSTDITYL